MPAPSGKDADPKESLWDFEGRGRRLAVIGAPDFACNVAGGPLEQPQLAGAGHGLLAACRVELEVDVASVGLDGVERHVQLGADLAQRQVGVQQAQDAELALAELLARGGGRSGRREAWRALAGARQLALGLGQPALQLR